MNIHFIINYSYLTLLSGSHIHTVLVPLAIITSRMPSLFVQLVVCLRCGVAVPPR